MRKLLLLILTMIFFLSCGNKVQLFEKYDFNSGEYSLHGILSEGDPSYFTEEIGDFMITDTIVLNKIKNEWKVPLTDKRMPCGYSYIIVLMKGDSCVDHFGINLECEYLCCDEGWYDFPAKLLHKYDKLVIMVPREEARAFHKMLIDNKTFVD